MALSARQALDSGALCPDKPSNLRIGPAFALVVFENAARGCRPVWHRPSDPKSPRNGTKSAAPQSATD